MLCQIAGYPEKECASHDAEASGKLAESSDKSERGEPVCPNMRPKNDGPKVRHDFQFLANFRTFSQFTRAAGDQVRGGGTPPVSELFDESYLAYGSASEVRLANRSVVAIASGLVDRQRPLVLLVNEQERLFATGHP